MRFGAYHSSDFIEFTPLPEISSNSYDFIAAVEGRQVHVGSLSLFDTEAFLRQLSVLRSRWSGIATLIGTYDFCIQVRALKPERLWVSVSAVDYISTLPTVDMPCARHILDAGFSLDDAAAIRLFEQFDELLTK